MILKKNYKIMAIAGLASIIAGCEQKNSSQLPQINGIVDTVSSVSAEYTRVNGEKKPIRFQLITLTYEGKPITAAHILTQGRKEVIKGENITFTMFPDNDNYIEHKELAARMGFSSQCITPPHGYSGEGIVVSLVKN